jgi:hypothetical protein
VSVIGVKTSSVVDHVLFFIIYSISRRDGAVNRPWPQQRNINNSKGPSRVIVCHVPRII